MASLAISTPCCRTARPSLYIETEKPFLNFLTLIRTCVLWMYRGYGYARVSKKGSVKVGRNEECAHIKAVVVGGSPPHPSADDVQMYEFGIMRFLVTALSGQVEQAWIQRIKKKLLDPSDDFILFSSVSKAGMDQLDAILENLRKMAKTPYGISSKSNRISCSRKMLAIFVFC